MTPESYSTRSLAPRHQFDAWRDWYSAVFEVTPKDPMGIGFAGETRLWNLGGVLISRTTAPGSRVVRARGHLARDPADHWVISYCVRGAYFAKTADKEIEVPVTVPFLWSLRQELLYERTHADWVQVFLARDAFGESAALFDKALASTLDAPLGRLLGDYLMALERRLPDVTGPDLPKITGSLGVMVAAAVAPSAERAAVAKPEIDFGRMERVRRAVRKHLRSPLLGPKPLARLVGMSRSSLYRLLDDRGGVARYIQRERLLAARQALADPANGATIAAIADEFCFADASSFGRVFKREFGHSPGDTRAAARAGLTLPAGPLGGPAAQGGNFSALLRGF